MKNPYLESIKRQIIQKLIKDVGFCACADGDNQAMLSFSSENAGFVITIKDVYAIDHKKGVNP